MIFGKLIGKEFQRYESLECGVLGFIDHTHPAATDLLDDAVVRNRSPGEWRGIGHWRESYANGELDSTYGPDHHPFPRAVALPLQHLQAASVPTGGRSFWRQLILGFFIEPLACQAVLDLKVFVFGRVAQHLEARELGVEFLILSPNGLLADRRGLPG